MNQVPHSRQTTHPEPTYDERLEIERAIAEDDQFEQWHTLRNADPFDRSDYTQEVRPMKESGGDYDYFIQRWVIPNGEWALHKTLTQPLDDYTESLREERGELYNGKRWEEC